MANVVNVWMRPPVAKARPPKTTEEYVAGIEARAAVLATRRHADAAERALRRAEATSTAEGLTMVRAKAILAKANPAAPVPMAEALRQVWREDPELYVRYRREQRAARVRPAPRGRA